LGYGAVRSTSTLRYRRVHVSALTRFVKTILTCSAQCSAATNHLITNAVFNISSDLIILSIPMPLLFKIRLQKKNKLVLVAIFMIGAFTVSSPTLPQAKTNKPRLLHLYSISTILFPTRTVHPGYCGISENRTPPCFAQTCLSPTHSYNECSNCVTGIPTQPRKTPYTHRIRIELQPSVLSGTIAIG
jgi:hypothetical protein